MKAVNKSTQQMKKIVLRLPGVTRLRTILAAINELPERNISDEAAVEKINTQLANLRLSQEFSKVQYQKVVESTARIEVLQDNVMQEVIDLGKRRANKSAERKKEDKPELFADNHLLDIFYANFEDHFRGSEEMIKERVADHLPLFTSSALDFKKFPVLDIGSGRGEFLQVLKESGVPAVGVDINHDMVVRAKDKDLEVIQGDAIEFLEKSRPQTYGAVTGFHIVEHIPFESLLSLFKAARKTLAPGGFVLFETPNPENISVAAHTFYLDPSHLRPLPPALLAFTLETCGYQKIEILRLHPADSEMLNSKKLLPDMANKFYGAQDYAIVAYK